MKAQLTDEIEIVTGFGGAENRIIERSRVPGRIVTPHFAVTESRTEFASAYALTHLPTGRAVTYAPSVAKLTRLARILEKRANWGFTDPKAVKQFEPGLIAAALREAGLA